MKKIILAMAVVVLLAACGSQKTAILTGKVVDNSKRNPVAKATVKVGDAQVVTDDKGTFKLEGIEVGKASIFVTADGFKPYEFSGYDFKDGQNTIEELLIVPEDKTTNKPSDSEIIPQPPMPGTKLDKIPAFKMFEKFANCTVTFIEGDPNNNGSKRIYDFGNGITKITQQINTPVNDPKAGSADIYVTDKKLIVNPSKEMGWMSMDKPPADPKMGEVSSPEKIPYFFYKSIFRNLTDKTSTVTSGGKVKLDGMECNKYYVVSDSNGNLIDGEFYTPLSGKYKDYLIKYSGRIVINGDGNKREINITNIDSAPAVVLPKNIKEMPVPKQQNPQMKIPTPDNRNP